MLQNDIDMKAGLCIKVHMLLIVDIFPTKRARNSDEMAKKNTTDSDSSAIFSLLKFIYSKVMFKHISNLSNKWGLGFGVWGLGFGVWEIGRAHV